MSDMRLFVTWANRRRGITSEAADVASRAGTVVLASRAGKGVVGTW